MTSENNTFALRDKINLWHKQKMSEHLYPMFGNADKKICKKFKVLHDNSLVFMGASLDVLDGSKATLDPGMFLKIFQNFLSHRKIIRVSGCLQKINPQDHTKRCNVTIKHVKSN